MSIKTFKIVCRAVMVMAVVSACVIIGPHMPIVFVVVVGAGSYISGYADGYLG